MRRADSQPRGRGLLQTSGAVSTKSRWSECAGHRDRVRHCDRGEVSKPGMSLGLSELVEWRGKIKIETERHGARIDGTQAACGSNAALPHGSAQYRAGTGSA